MKQIELTKGKFALVDDEDFEKVSQYKWCFNQGYVIRGKWNKGKTDAIAMHRFIMNAQKGELVDHINHNGLDNRRQNLRIATRQQNAINSFKPINNTSGYKGVNYMKGEGRVKRWRAVIKFNQKYIHIGYFMDAIEASRAYDKKAKELFGEFAYLNLC